MSLSRPTPWLVPLLLMLTLGAVSACGPDTDTAEEHRRLSLRVEHDPPGRHPAGENAPIRADINSSLERPRLEAWIRLVGSEPEVRIPLRITEDGEAVGEIAAGERGDKVRYVIEARDAAGLVVALPKGADDGKAYELRFEGPSSPILGGIAWLSTLLAILFYLGAGLAGIQCLRGQMSPGPAGMLGGFGVAVAVAGLFLIGGIHAFQLTGKPWPSTPLWMSLSRADLALVTALWVLTLVLGRAVLLDEAPDGTASGERAFATAGVLGAALTIIFLLI